MGEQKRRNRMERNPASVNGFLSLFLSSSLSLSLSFFRLVNSEVIVASKRYGKIIVANKRYS